MLSGAKASFVFCWEGSQYTPNPDIMVSHLTDVRLSNVAIKGYKALNGVNPRFVNYAIFTTTNHAYNIIRKNNLMQNHGRTIHFPILVL